MKSFFYAPLQANLTAICMGGADFGKYHLDDACTFRLLDTYLSLGGNWIDTAHMYADWEPGEKSSSERQIGRWVKNRGHRNDVFIASKGAHPDLRTMDISRVNPADIVFDLGEGLQVSGLDYFDLYYLHRDDVNAPVADIIDCLEEQVKKGKIRAYGASNWRGARIAEANAYAKSKGYQGFTASEILFSAAKPNELPGDDKTLVRMDKAEHAYYESVGDIFVTGFTSQAKGYLTKRASGLPVGEGLAAAYGSDVNDKIFALAQDIAAAHNVSVTAVSLAYIYSQVYPAAPILGCKSVAHIEDCMKHGDFVLSPDEMAAINAIRFV